MPRLSDSMEEGTILRWLKSVGDEVKRGDELVEIETDKANMTYEASDEGMLVEIVAQEGDTLPIGEVIARIGSPGEKVEAGKGSGKGSGKGARKGSRKGRKGERRQGDCGRRKDRGAASFARATATPAGRICPRICPSGPGWGWAGEGLAGGEANGGRARSRAPRNRGVWPGRPDRQGRRRGRRRARWRAGARARGAAPAGRGGTRGCAPARDGQGRGPGGGAQPAPEHGRQTHGRVEGDRSRTSTFSSRSTCPRRSRSGSASRQSPPSSDRLRASTTWS